MKPRHKLPQYQRDALLVLRTQLDPRSPENDASDEIKAHLRAITGWLECWVIPALDSIEFEREPGTQWLRASISRHAYRIRRGTAARKVAEAYGNPELDR